MKKILLSSLLLVSLFLGKSIAQFEPKDTIFVPAPKYYLGAGTGVNSYTGMFGLRGDVRLTNKILLNVGAGVGLWGAKTSIGLSYQKAEKGWGYDIGYSQCFGRDATVKLEITTGIEEDVDLSLLSVGVINLGVSYHWVLRNRNRINLEVGYAIGLLSEAFEPKSTSLTLSSTAKDAMIVMQPGGLMLGISYSFAL